MLVPKEVKQWSFVLQIELTAILKSERNDWRTAERRNHVYLFSCHFLIVVLMITLSTKILNSITGKLIANLLYICNSCNLWCMWFFSQVYRSTYCKCQKSEPFQVTFIQNVWPFFFLVFPPLSSFFFHFIFRTSLIIWTNTLSGGLTFWSAMQNLSRKGWT